LFLWDFCKHGNFGFFILKQVGLHREIRMKTKERVSRALLLLLFASIALVGCATQPKPLALDLPGFFSGLLHGFMILFSLIGSIFMDIRMYAFPNSGFWYDAGFFVGASAFLGGGAASAR
jgi:hypothetical protein